MLRISVFHSPRVSSFTKIELFHRNISHFNRKSIRNILEIKNNVHELVAARKSSATDTLPADREGPNQGTTSHDSSNNEVKFRRRGYQYDVMKNKLKKPNCLVQKRVMKWPKKC